MLGYCILTGTATGERPVRNALNRLSAWSLRLFSRRFRLAIHVVFLPPVSGLNGENGFDYPMSTGGRISSVVTLSVTAWGR